MHLILSPHFDDAVYSLGGAIHTWVQASQPVVVLNVMGAQPAHLPDSPILRDLHQRWAIGESPVAIRQQEDAQALAHLGVQHHNLPFVDCIYRTDTHHNPLYPSEASLFQKIHPADDLPAHLHAFNLEERIQTPLSQCHLYAPLAIGNHVDHQIVRDWALTLTPRSRHLYADYPYTRDADATARAHQQIPHLTLKPAAIPLTIAALNAKIEAVICYQSQMSTFWQDEDALRQDVTRAFTTPQGTYQENVWQAYP